MTVNRLSNDRVLITLCHKDMDDFLLDFKSMSLSDSHSRRVIMRIMQVACRRSGISVSGKSVNVEAMLFGDDCYLLVTVAKKRRSHTSSIRRRRRRRRFATRFWERTTSSVNAASRIRLSATWARRATCSFLRPAPAISGMSAILAFIDSAITPSSR